MLRRWLSMLALLVSLGITGAAAIEVARQGVPAEAAAGAAMISDAGPAASQALRRELLAPDLAGKTRAEKLQVVASLEQHVVNGDPLPGFAHLNERQLHQLEANLAALGQAWLLNSVEVYFSLMPDERDAFLDDLADQLLDLQTKAAAPGGANAQLSKVYGLSMGSMKERFEAWRKSASPLEQLRVAAFVVALKKRVSERFEIPRGSRPEHGFRLR